MKRLDTTSLMIIIHYLNNYESLQKIPFINKKLSDVLLSFKVNPEINQQVLEKHLKYFPNIQTLSCSMEDYIKFEQPKEYDLYRLRIEWLSFDYLQPFLLKLHTLKILFLTSNSQTHTVINECFCISIFISPKANI